MTVYRVACSCGGFAVATLSHYEANSFANFHRQWNSDIKMRLEPPHEVRVMALAAESRPAQMILEAYASWATGVPA